MAEDSVSKVFPGADYVSFSPAERILYGLGHMDMDELQKLIGCDCWGVSIKDANGHVKEAFFNSYDRWNHDDPIRNLLLQNIDFAASRVGYLEKLVVYMFQANGWVVEATNAGEGDWRYTFKHSPYLRAINVANPPTELTVDSITIKCTDIENVTGVIEPLKWSHLPRQSLLINLANEEHVVFTLEPNRGEAHEPAGDYHCIVRHNSVAKNETLQEVYTHERAANAFLDELEKAMRGWEVD